MSINLDNNNMQTRFEHSRSIDDAERFKALDTLIKLGLLKRVKDIDTYHGRVGKKNDQSTWQVDPAFSNGGNASGNNNINERPTLYTGDKQLAEDFAIKRALQATHNILSKQAIERIGKYTQFEKQAWLDRLNQREKEEWNNLPESEKKLYSNGPKVYKIEDLEKPHFISEEAGRLIDNLSMVEKRNFLDQNQHDLQIEIHEIATEDPDSTIIDLNFDVRQLKDEDKQKYKEALKTLLIPVTEGSPIDFNLKDDFIPIADEIMHMDKHILSTNDVDYIVKKLNVDKATATQLAGAYNSRYIISKDPQYIIKKMIRYNETIITDKLKSGSEEQEYPINLEYIERYLRLAHIVGVEQRLLSATLKKRITSFSFFDLEKTNTTESLKAERSNTWKKLGATATALSELLPEEVMPKNKLKILLQDAHAKPEKLIEAAKQVEGFKEIFEADTGNWEGYTLAEHTETVLRNFEENYANKIPAALLIPMRLAIISHDIGKPLASARRQKHLQKEYSALLAKNFLTKLNIDHRLIDVILAVIGDGASLAYKIDIQGAGDEAKTALINLANTTIRKYKKDSDNIKDQIVGFVEMCRMLQVCDGGAYTSMAITNKHGKGRYRNAPSFNNSFVHPNGLGKRKIQLRRNSDGPQKKRLTPI